MQNYLSDLFGKYFFISQISLVVSVIHNTDNLVDVEVRSKNWGVIIMGNYVKSNTQTERFISKWKIDTSGLF